MKYRAIARPKSDPGITITQKKQVVPDQSMSLRDILIRFTRGEAVPGGHNGHYDELADTEDSVDLSKLIHADLVDRDEHIQFLKEKQARFKKQATARQSAAAEKEKAAQAVPPAPPATGSEPADKSAVKPT